MNIRKQKNTKCNKTMKILTKYKNKALTNFDILELVKILKIPNFRGVFMKDQLPFTPKNKECGILNLNNSHQNGSHWVCWYKNKNNKIYFDSYGVYPPKELIDYLKQNTFINYNTDRVQPFGTIICGHLCLYMLNQLSKNKKFNDIIFQLINSNGN